MTSIVGTGLEGYIKRNARERALNRIAEAEIEARRLTEHAEAQATAILEQATENAKLVAQQTRQRALAQAEIEAQAISLKRRESVLQRVWQLAREQLCGLSPTQRAESLLALVVDAAAQLGGPELLLEINADDAPLLTDELLAEMAERVRPFGVERLRLANNSADILGGVIVRCPATPGVAQRLVDNSWDERLRLAYDTIRDEVYALLAAPEGDQPEDRGALS